MYCATNQFPELQFLGPCNKPNGVHVLGKHYHIRFYPKLGHITCSMRYIPCACTMCTSMIDQPWFPGMPAQKNTLYQPVKDCTYWPMLCYFNKWNIIKLPYKATASEEVEKINQVVLDGISYNMASFVQSGKYGAINTTYTTTVGYYVIKFLS